MPKITLDKSISKILVSFTSLFTCLTASAEFEYTITDPENNEVIYSQSAADMALTAISGGSRPCIITISLLDTKAKLSERSKLQPIELLFSDQAGLQTGNYKVNPEATSSPAWHTENTKQVYANWAAPRENGKTPYNGHSGTLTITRSGTNIVGSFKGEFIQYGVSAFGKRIGGKTVNVSANFSHTLAINSNSFTDTYRCK